MNHNPGWPVRVVCAVGAAALYAEVSLRIAAYMLAINRVSEMARVRGVYA